MTDTILIKLDLSDINDSERTYLIDEVLKRIEELFIAEYPLIKSFGFSTWPEEELDE